MALHELRCCLGSCDGVPMPAEVMAALRTLNAQQKREKLTLGPTWTDTGLIAINEDGLPDSARDLLQGIPPPLHRSGRAGDPVARHQAHRRDADTRQRRHGVCGGEVAGPRSGDGAAGVRPRVRRSAGVGG